MNHEDALSLGEHYATIQSVKLWYHVKGRGRPLLFQGGGAGWGGDITPYIETLGPLETVRKVIYLEPRGIGRSERLSDPASYSMDMYVEEMEALRQYFEIPKLAIAAHCYGGFLALKYAIRYPESVERLLLLDTTPHLLLGDIDGWRRQRKGYEEAFTRYESIIEKARTPQEKENAWIQTLLPVEHFHNYVKVSSIVERVMGNMIWGLDANNYFDNNERETYDLRGRLRNISVPTLIVAGEDDFLPIKLGSKLLNDEISTSELVIIENCGHWPMIEQPKALFEVILPFLSQ